MSKRQWIVDGRKADGRALEALLNAARSDKLKRMIAIRAERADDLLREIDLKKVGAAVRRIARQQEREARRRIHLLAWPQAGRYPAERECRRFDDVLGLKKLRFKRPARDGLCSFHCRFTSRGLGNRRLKKGHVFRSGETVRQLRYILRPEARELSQGVVSNVSHDPDELAGVFAALEELEQHDRLNSNVYMSLIIALPHELSPEGRERVLGQICDLLGEHGLPYVGVLHAPDKDGDQRNYHAHILFSLRPIEVEGPGRYAFSAEKYSDLNDASFIKPFRCRVAELLNSAMEAEDLGRRFTGYSDAERGLAPRKKGTGKNSPGQNAAKRNEEDLKLISEEQDLRTGYGNALRRLTSLVKALLAEPAINLAIEVTKRRDRLAASIASASAQQPINAPTPVRDAAIIPSSVSVARAQPAHAPYTSVDLENDPERLAAITTAADALTKIDHPPLRRRGDRFELDPSCISSPPFETIDRFDSAGPIQKIYASKWRSNLDAIELALDHAPVCPIEMGDQPVLKQGLLSASLQPAFQAAAHDQAMFDLLTRVWQRWEERRLRRKRQLQAGIAALKDAAALHLPQLLARCPADSREDVEIAARIVTKMFAAGEMRMSPNATVPTLLLADPSDSYWVERLRAAHEGEAFLRAIGSAAQGMPVQKKLAATMVLERSTPMKEVAPSRNLGRAPERNEDFGR